MEEVRRAGWNGSLSWRVEQFERIGAEKDDGSMRKRERERERERLLQEVVLFGCYWLYWCIWCTGRYWVCE